MRVSSIVFRLRDAQTIFNDAIGGVAELELVRQSKVVTKDMAFVIPIEETVEENIHEATLTQNLEEKFAVIVVLDNDSSQKDKYGLLSYDRLHDIRSQLFRALVGWEPYIADSKIEYAGGQLLPLNPAYLWYQFDFKYALKLVEFDGYCDLQGSDLELESGLRDRIQVSQLPELLRLYTNYKLAPSEDLPYTGDLPLNDNYPDVKIPDFAQFIDTSDDKNPGAYGRAYGSGFDFYRILNRKNDPK